MYFSDRTPLGSIPRGGKGRDESICQLAYKKDDYKNLGLHHFVIDWLLNVKVIPLRNYLCTNCRQAKHGIPKRLMFALSYSVQ